jgi:predicted polyphosphate/ATP-dependent NAD kinase
LSEVALARGAEPTAPERAIRALRSLVPVQTKLRLAGAEGEMGQAEAAVAGLEFDVLYRPGQRTGAQDTIVIAQRILNWDPDLILFAGGDGTARDIMAAVGQNCPVLGIPAGVKMHSAVFARTARDAGALAAALAEQAQEHRAFSLAEVVDRGAEDVPEIFGTMLVPRDPRRMQPAKASPGLSGQAELEGACRHLAKSIRDADQLTIIGPGSTTHQLKHQLSARGTLLGVDIYSGEQMIVEDADERAILRAIDNHPARLILGIIGGQGFLIGRGNQQISPTVIRTIGRENILGLASVDKLAALTDRTLYADTGEDVLDAELAGYIPVQVSATRQVLMPLNSHLRTQRDQFREAAR